MLSGLQYTRPESENQAPRTKCPVRYVVAWRKEKGGRGSEASQGSGRKASAAAVIQTLLANPATLTAAASSHLITSKTSLSSSDPDGARTRNHRIDSPVL